MLQTSNLVVLLMHIQQYGPSLPFPSLPFLPSFLPSLSPTASHSLASPHRIFPKRWWKSSLVQDLLITLFSNQCSKLIIVSILCTLYLFCISRVIPSQLCFWTGHWMDALSKVCLQIMNTLSVRKIYYVPISWYTVPNNYWYLSWIWFALHQMILLSSK